MADTIENIVFGLLILLLLFFAAMWINDSKKYDKMLTENDSLKAHNSELLKENNYLCDAIIKQDSLLEIVDFERLIMSVIEVESRGNPNAEYQGCNGLMQIKNGTFEPVQNVADGSKMVAHLIAKSVNDADTNTTAEEVLHRTLTAYNRGWHGANKYKAKTGTFTSDYSKKVLEKYYKFKDK